MATAEVIRPTEAATQLEVVVNRNELLAELEAAVSVVERKTTIPILANLLIETLEDGSLKISATNLNQSLVTSLPAEIHCQGSATVPARKLYDYVKLLGGDKVVIRREQNHWIYVRCGKSKTRMVGIEPCNFPQLKTAPSETRDLAAPLFASFAEKALVTVSKDESRFQLNAVAVEIASGKLTMVSMDGNRLTRISKSLDDTVAPLSALISKDALVDVLRLLKSGFSVIEFSEDSASLYFRVGVRTLTSRKLAGRFPGYASAIPSPSASPIILDSEAISQSIERCLVFSEAPTRPIALSLTSASLKLSSAANGIGETEEEHEIFGGPEAPFRIRFNGDYLRDTFRQVGSGNMELGLKDGNSAALFIHRTDDGITLESVIMPMRLVEKK